MENKVALEKGEQQSKTCISMLLLQKCAITKVPSILECMRKSALFHKYFTMPFLTPEGNTIMKFKFLAICTLVLLIKLIKIGSQDTTTN